MMGVLKSQPTTTGLRPGENRGSDADKRPSRRFPPCPYVRRSRPRNKNYDRGDSDDPAPPYLDF